VFVARCRARIRRRARLWRAGLANLFPRPTERRLFGRWVRYLDRRYLDCWYLDSRGVPRFDSVSRERAAVLLAGHLSGSQRRCLCRSGFFVVTGKSGRRFRVWARRHMPVELIDSVNSRPRHNPWLYCIHNDPSEGIAAVPLADYLLELKLCLEAAEEYFLVTSNPNFERGQIEKEELLRKVAFADWLFDGRDARH
jgi:hypothetical protein